MTAHLTSLMSFTFRDLFSDDEGEESSELEPGAGREMGGLGLQGAAKAPAEHTVPYQVSDLIPFIPPAIVASSGIPMEKEVFVPVPPDGSLDVKLSTLYQVCPELFATEITPLNDSEVALPAKIGARIDPARPSASPFFAPSETETSQAATSPGAGGNPFWSKTGQAPESVEPAAPGVQAPGGPAPGADLASLGALSDSIGTPAKKGVVVGWNSKPSSVVAKKKEGEDGPAPGIPGPLSPGGNPSPQSGATPEASSADQGGGFGDPNNPFESGQGFATLFSTKAEEDSDIPYPETTEAGPDAESNGAQKAAEAANPSPFKAPTGPIPVNREPDAFSESPSQAAPKQAPAKPAPVQTREKPSPAGKKAEPAAATPSASPSPALAIASGSNEDETLRDLEFRAIFSTSESFSLSKVARHVVELDGVHGCALATPTKLVQAAKSDQNRPGDEARDMVESIRNVARLSGMPEAKSFTLQTDRGSVSLFLEGDCCVTVTHESEEFAPGVREKLILIARSIHKLTE